MKALLTVLMVLFSATLFAAPATYNYTGTVTTAMVENNGSSQGTIAVGSPFSGTLTFDDAQVVTPVAFSGGTHSVFTFTQMSLTLAGSTVTWGPGTIDVYNKLTTSASGYPVGDSLYANFTGLAPSGPINGAQFNWVLLALVDNTGTAFTDPTRMPTLNFASFQSQFIEFNFGTTGTPFGAGNTSMLQFLSTLSQGSGSSNLPPTITTTVLPNGTYGVPYNLPVTATGPAKDPITITLAGLPNGLVFKNGSILGAPGAVGTSQVTITALDSVTGLSTAATLPLVVNDASISFTPVLPNGVVNTSYTASFGLATGGTGLFTYSATGLPAGLTLNFNTISGTPTAVSNTPVTITAKDTVGTTLSVSVPLTITGPVAAPCSGTNAVESAFVPRNPGFIVVNGGFNLLDHLWTTLLTKNTVTFNGGLTNWYKTGLILSYTGTVDPNGCILDHLTVSPAVEVSTTTLPAGEAGLAYAAPVTVAWGVAPYSVTVAGLPTGLVFNGSSITGTPKTVGTSSVVVTAIDSLGATAKVSLPLVVTDQAIAFSPALPAGTVGSAYTASLSAAGFGPFSYSATGLPAGLSVIGTAVTGKPTVAGTFPVVLTVKDAAGQTATATVSLLIRAKSSYTIQDEGQGNVTSIGDHFVMVGSKKILWNASTKLILNDTTSIQVGMLAQWSGKRDAKTGIVLASSLEIN